MRVLADVHFQVLAVVADDVHAFTAILPGVTAQPDQPVSKHVLSWAVAVAVIHHFPPANQREQFLSSGVAWPLVPAGQIRPTELVYNLGLFLDNGPKGAVGFPV